MVARSRSKKRHPDMNARHILSTAAIPLALTLAAGCSGGTQGAPPQRTPTSGVSDRAAEAVAERVFCGDGGLYESFAATVAFAIPPGWAVLQVEVPAIAHASRARASFSTVAGEIHGEVNTHALGLIVQEDALMIGAPVQLRAGDTVCVPLHGETPDSLPCEATVLLPVGWTFERMPPIRVQDTSYTWRGRVERSAVATTRATGNPRSFNGQFNGSTIELLSEDGELLARGPAPHFGTMIRGRRGELLEVALADLGLGMHGLHGFIRTPPTPDPPQPAVGVLSGSFGMGGLGLSGTGQVPLPREARPLAELATDRPLRALVPGSVMTLPTGQQLTTPSSTYARVTVGTRWVFAVLADGTFLRATVDPDALGEVLREAVPR